MNRSFREKAERVLQRGIDSLNATEKEVVGRFLARHHISRNVTAEFEDQRTFGERVADRVARFGGSWTFILIFATALVAWVVLNSYILARRDEAFDPYPYILLNLFLSMLAAIQAPIIMMSQNRQAAKDRLDAAHDYQVNLKAELEILSLHEKLDNLREQKWESLLRVQQEQIELLTRLLEEREAGRHAPDGPGRDPRPIQREGIDDGSEDDGGAG